jgi:hypothetical protein
VDPISSLSRERLHIWVEGATGIEEVEIAFTTQNAEPVPADWKPADWGAVASDGADATILVGPGGGGAVELADGTYTAWVRITTAQEEPILRAGLVPVI